MEQVKEHWTLWACGCGSTMKFNRIATKEDYDRFKACVCGGLLEYKNDLTEDEI